MDWEREAQSIRDLAGLESEIISAIVNAPTQHLAAIAAVEPGGMCWFCHAS